VEKQITIRAPKAILRKWLKALRTGGYKQGKGVMYNPKTYGFCCLGVLQHCVTRGEVEVNEWGFAAAPSPEWLQEHGIEFKDKYGMQFSYPYLPPLNTGAAQANDGCGARPGKSFKAIAKAIEVCAEGY
jgi:hypothetical protein